MLEWINFNFFIVIVTSFLSHESGDAYLFAFIYHFRFWISNYELYLCMQFSFSMLMLMHCAVCMVAMDEKLINYAHLCFKVDTKNT